MNSVFTTLNSAVGGEFNAFGGEFNAFDGVNFRHYKEKTLISNYVSS